MAKFKNILTRIFTPFIDAYPELIFAILRRRHLSTVIKRFEIGLTFDWDITKLPKEINGFEDLSCLFWSTQITRGIIRQDIDEAATLYRIISKLKKPYGVEIGRFTGGSTVLLASAVGLSGKIMSIDIDPINDAVLNEVLIKFNLQDRVKMVTGDANDEKMNPDFPVDFLFIDGDHSYEGARRDHNKWGAYVKPGGYIIHHDMSSTRNYSSQHPDLARLRNDILNVQSGQIVLVEEVGSMAFFQKTGIDWNRI